MKKFLFALVVLSLPMMLSAQEIGQVIGYMQGSRDAPTDAEWNNMTHLILFQIFPNSAADGSGLDLGWWPSENNKAQSIINAAHSKGKKVIVGLGGASSWEVKGRFIPATSDANRARFVQTLKKFVDDWNLDGIDLDWETQVDWRQFLELSLDMKKAMPNKRITITIGPDSPFCQYGNHFTTDAALRERYRKEIWAIDGVQLMTYDMNGESTGQNQQIHWGNNAASWASASEKVIDEWAAFGQGQPGFGKEKIFIGVHYQQDNESSARQKVRYARQNSFGGAILWEIKGSTHAHLPAMWDENTKYGGHTGTTVAGSFKITVTYSQSGGTVKNGNSTVTSGAQIDVKEGENLTLTFEANSGYSVTDVKIGGTSNDVAKTSGTYTFSNVKANETFNVVFAKDGGEPNNSPDLVDGSFEWEEMKDAFGTGSSASVNAAAKNVTFDISIGTTQGTNYAWAKVVSYLNGDLSGLTSIDITYTSNKSIILTLVDEQDWDANGRGFNVVLESGTNRVVNIPWSQFKQLKEDAPDWIEISPDNWIADPNSPNNFDNLAAVQLQYFTGVSISPADKNASGTVTSLKLNGVVLEDCDLCPDCQNCPCTCANSTVRNNKTISRVMSAGIINGTLNLSLPTTAKNATVMLFDVRGRLLFNSQVSISAGAASVALPKNIAQNQAAILQVKTNSGVNLTKRVLIK